MKQRSLVSNRYFEFSDLISLNFWLLDVATDGIKKSVQKNNLIKENSEPQKPVVKPARSRLIDYSSPKPDVPVKLSKGSNK